MDIINVSCAEIQTPAGFLYVILPVILNQADNPDCDQSWLSEVSVFSVLKLYHYSLSVTHTHTHTHTHDPLLFYLFRMGRLIADPSDPQKLIDPVISVSSDRLVTSHCVNLNHEIICDSAGVNQLNLSQHASV